MNRSIVASPTVLIERVPPGCDQGKKALESEKTAAPPPTQGTPEISGVSRCSFGRRGYTVRPSALPLEAVSSEAPGDDPAAPQFLRAPLKFDSEGVSIIPSRTPSPRSHNNFMIEDDSRIQILRVNCNQDFPSSWQPARRIISFMAKVSLTCTLLVVAIIVVAVLLSRTAAQSRDMTSSPTPDILYLVIPQPRLFLNRSVQTIVASRHTPRVWQRHAKELGDLLHEYRKHQGTIASSNCDLHYAPIGVSSCSFPLDRISDNCTEKNNFGYDTGNPCVALIFLGPGWNALPINNSDLKEVPELIRDTYDPKMLPLTCNASAIHPGSGEKSVAPQIVYSPYAGFPLSLLPFRRTDLPPLVMLQFLTQEILADVEVNCTLWARNKSRNKTGSVVSIRFSLYIF